MRVPIPRLLRLVATGMSATPLLGIRDEECWDSDRTRSGSQYRARLKEDVDRLCPINSLEVGV
jgi:hypothetical protein